MNAHDPNRFIELLSDDFTLYNPSFPGGLRGRQATLEDLRRDLAAFPDLQFRTDRIVGIDDLVFVQGSLTGTNTGPLISLMGKRIRATRQRVEIRKSLSHRVENGRIAETQDYYDQAQVDAQLGVRRQMGTRLAMYGAAGLVLTATTGFMSLLHIGVVADRDLFGIFAAGIWLISVSIYYSKKNSK